MKGNKEAGQKTGEIGWVGSRLWRPETAGIRQAFPAHSNPWHLKSPRIQVASCQHKACGEGLYRGPARGGRSLAGFGPCLCKAHSSTFMRMAQKGNFSLVAWALRLICYMSIDHFYSGAPASTIMYIGIQVEESVDMKKNIYITRPENTRTTIHIPQLD